MYSDLVELAHKVYVEKIGNDDYFDSSEVIFDSFEGFDLGGFSYIEAKVGAYIVWNDNNALNMWKEDTQNKKLSEEDLEVDRIMKSLF